MTTINIGDKVRYTDERYKDWLGQEGIVENIDGLIEYRITKPVPDSQWGVYCLGMNKVGSVVSISESALTVIEPATTKAKFKVGDKVRYATGTTHWVGQEGIVTNTDEEDITVYRLTKPSPHHDRFAVKGYNTVGNEVRLRSEKLELVEETETPTSAFKVGDVVRLTKKGGTQQGMAYLREGLRGTLTRVHWYSTSEEWGYKMEIPGITDDTDLRWVKEYEFYEGDFILETVLINAPLEELKKAKPGAVVWDGDGDKWVRVSRKKADIWVYVRTNGTTPKDSLLAESSEDLRSDFGPISFIKP